LTQTAIFIGEDSSHGTRRQRRVKARGAAGRADPPTTVTSVLRYVRRIPPELACFSLVTAVYLVYFGLWGYDRFYWDSATYWRLGMDFEHNGHFSLAAYDDRLRGYSFPLLNHVLQSVASAVSVSDVTIVRIAGALSAAALGVVVLPRLARALFSEAAVGWGRVLALNGLIFLYWRGHFEFPLSDFPALLATSIGILGLLRGNVAGYFMAGVGFGLAANIRPAYLPVAVVALAAVALLPLRPWEWLRRGKAVTLVALGMLLVSAPQIAINHHQRGGWSPLIPGAGDLTNARLSAGMYVQRTETYVGPRDEYPRSLVFYFDPVGSKVYDEERVDETLGTREYLGIVLRHPIAMAASYLLHTFNGFDVKYPTPYVRDLRATSILLSLFQYTVLFAGAMWLLLPEGRQSLGRIRWLGIVVLVVPTLTAITSALEPRYFLPLHMLVYMLVCFGPWTRELLLAGGTSRRLRMAVPCVVFVAGCVILSSATQAQIEYPLSAGANRVVIASDAQKAASIPGDRSRQSPPSEGAATPARRTGSAHLPRSRRRTAEHPRGGAARHG
jgi:hypothetical protein